jgi:hypothetical protein
MTNSSFDSELSTWLNLFELTTHPESDLIESELNRQRLTRSDPLSACYVAAWWYFTQQRHRAAHEYGYLTAVSLLEAQQSGAFNYRMVSLTRMLDRAYRLNLAITIQEAASLSELARHIGLKLKQAALQCPTL